MKQEGCKPEKNQEGVGLADLLSFQSCWSSAVQDVQVVDFRECDERKRRRRVGAGTRRGNGYAGNQSFLERCVKASTWTLMVKVAM